MKKVLGILATTAMLVSVQAAEQEVEDNEPGQIGIGIQGTFMSNGTGGTILIPAATARWAPGPIGGELVVGRASTDTDGGTESTYTLLQAKGLYTLIQRKQSALYAGGQLGFIFQENDFAGGGDSESTTVLIGALIGSEFRLEEIPEMSFNFEIGYGFGVLETENSPGADVDTDFSGLALTVGTRYYF